MARGWLARADHLPRGQSGFQIRIYLSVRYLFLCTFFPPAGEKYQKRRRIRENLRFFLMYPFPLMVGARGTAAFDCAPYTPIPIAPSCRQLSTNSDSHGRRVVGRGFQDGRLILICLFSKGKLQFFISWCKYLPTSRVLCATELVDSCRQLGTTGIGVYGAQSTWRSHGAHHAREGIFKVNRRFPLERRLFWYFSPAGGRKVQRNVTFKSNPPINPNVTIQPDFKIRICRDV